MNARIVPLLAASLLIASITLAASSAATPPLESSSANAASLPIAASIQAPGSAGSIATSPDGSTIYTADRVNNAVEVMSAATGAFIDEIPVGSLPNYVAITPDGTQLFVANQSGNSISVINTATDAVTTTVHVEPGPFDIVVSPDGSTAYVLNGDEYQAINTTSYAVSSPSEFPKMNVYGIAVSPDGSTLYVSVGNGAGTNAVKVVDASTGSVSATIPLTTQGAAAPYLSADGSTLYALNTYLNVIDTATATVTSTSSLSGNAAASVTGTYGEGVISRNGSTIYFTDGRTDLGVLDTATGTLSEVPIVNDSIVPQAVSADGSLVDATDYDDTVSVLSTITPFALSAKPQGQSDEDVSWSPPLTGDATVTGYKVLYSTNGGNSWHDATDVSSTSTDAAVSAPPTGASYVYAVEAKTASGTSGPSPGLVVSGGGTSSQDFSIQTASGAPVTGGAVSWISKDGNSASSVSYALTANGDVTFPETVVGPATVTLTGGILPSGATVSGSWTVALGTSTQTLTLPEAPSLSTPEVTVTMPNQVPVVNAEVNTGTKLPVTQSSDGFTFTAPGGGATDVFTDGNGNATLVGYGDPSVPLTARVTYNDGVLDQGQTVTLTGAQTNVQLNYMPWLTVTDSGTVNAGNLDAVEFAVNDSSPPDAMRLHGATSHAKPRVKISIKPPAGWSSKRCKKASKLSGTTSKTGHLKLAICASRSGAYQVKSHGAVPTRVLTLRVKGAPPTSPLSVSARSPKPGQAKVAWAAPAFAGGARITSYRVVAALKGHHSRSVTLRRSHFPSSSLVHTFTGLTRAKTWTIRVIAITRFGASPAGSCKLRVA